MKRRVLLLTAVVSALISAANATWGCNYVKNDKTWKSTKLITTKNLAQNSLLETVKWCCGLCKAETSETCRAYSSKYNPGGISECRLYSAKKTPFDNSNGFQSRKRFLGIGTALECKCDSVTAGDPHIITSDGMHIWPQFDKSRETVNSKFLLFRTASCNPLKRDPVDFPPVNIEYTIQSEHPFGRIKTLVTEIEYGRLFKDGKDISLTSYVDAEKNPQTIAVVNGKPLDTKNSSHICGNSENKEGKCNGPAVNISTDAEKTKITILPSLFSVVFLRHKRTVFTEIGNAAQRLAGNVVGQLGNLDQVSYNDMFCPQKDIFEYDRCWRSDLVPAKGDPVPGSWDKFYDCPAVHKGDLRDLEKYTGVKFQLSEKDFIEKR